MNTQLDTITVAFVHTARTFSFDYYSNFGPWITTVIKIKGDRVSCWRVTITSILIYIFFWNGIKSGRAKYRTNSGRINNGADDTFDIVSAVIDTSAIDTCTSEFLFFCR